MNELKIKGVYEPAEKVYKITVNYFSSLFVLV
jgi:hypothetical protein